MSRWTVKDVMTTEVVAVREDAQFRDIVDLLETHRVSGLPVVDRDDVVVGVVSESDLLARMEFTGEPGRPRLFEGRQARTAREKANGELARELMTAPPVTVLVDTPIVGAARLMASARVKRLPVTNLTGRLIGIVTRSDLLKVFTRGDDEIRSDVSRTLRNLAAVEAADLAIDVYDGVVTLTGELEHRSSAETVVELARHVDGVIRVVDRLTYRHDEPATAFAHLR